MSFYIILNIIIVCFPLLLTFEKRVSFYKKLVPALGSIAIVGFFFILWDFYATYDNHWSFNPDYVSDITIFNLPLGEVLFFITVPYSCLFIYECFCVYFPKRGFSFKSLYAVILAIIPLIISILFYKKTYTFLVFLSVAVFFIAASLPNLFKKLLGDINYWEIMFIVFILFAIFNGILTSLPVVLYNGEKILNVRAYTIPIEDFFYNYLLISLNIGLYKYFKERNGVPD